MRRRAAGLALLLAGCQGSGGRVRNDPEAARPDVRALAIPTHVQAKRVTLVIAARWESELKLEGIRKQRPGPHVLVARGKAVLRLRQLTVEADEIEVRTIADPGHEDLLLHARQVKRFEQVVRYGHRTENADAVTMANEQVSIFKQ